jgi:Ca2+-binding RTX toxin-like protein
MATYLFSALNNNQTLTFNPALDTLAIDIAWMNAAWGGFLPSGPDLLLTYNGQTVRLAGVTLAQLSSSHITFANGSRLLIGDDTPGTVSDDLANTLAGTAQGDYLDGLGGADSLTGGDGNDIYIVDNAGDTVIETNASATQIDTVRSSLASYTLPANVENLRLLGTDPLNGAGNSLNNTLYGNEGHNVLEGGAGDDTFHGHAGTDTLIGGDGNDALYGWTGADTLIGGAGDDTYGIDNAGDLVQEMSGEGTDTVWSYLSYTLGANLENLRLREVGNLNGTGNGLDNVLYANSGDNVLNGAGGLDTVSYQYATAGVTVSLAITTAQATGGSGVDTLLNIENLAGGGYDDTLTGDGGDNVLEGGLGNDLLSGGAGADILKGGDGNDTYGVDNTGDVVVENAGAGTDTVRSSLANYTLPANVENLTLTGTAHLNGTGNALANTLTGNSGNNVLDGNGSADTLNGGGGHDALRVPDLNFQNLDGGNGTDTLLLAGTGLTLDLTALGAKLHDLEIIDLHSANTLTLTATAVQNLSTTSNRLVVDGTAESVVNAGLGWTKGADATANDHTYRTYIQGAATLWVDTAITLNINGVLSLASLNGSNGFRLDGVTAGDQSGWSVRGAGDVNGDGFADLIIGAPYAAPNGNPHAGSSYVVFGQASGFAAPLDLSTLNGSNGFRLDGVTGKIYKDYYSYYGETVVGDISGQSVSAAGDINGDGFADLLVGAPEVGAFMSFYRGSTSYSGSGASYVVFGKASGFAPALDLSALNGANGFRLEDSDAWDRSGGGMAGASVSAAGDVNGDGFADLVVGAPLDNSRRGYDTGSSYVVFGKASGFSATLDLATLNGANGFRLNGATMRDESGRSVSAAGDVNGDGFDDLIVGANRADPYGKSYAGSSYVVFGKAAGFAATLNLSTLNGSNGFRLDGATEWDFSGTSVSAAGDVNGDGFGDLLVGASRADPNGKSYAGSSYVVFGKASGFSATLDLSTLNGTNGFRLDGAAADDQAGRSVSAAGDVNGDGFADLLIGASRTDPNGNDRAGSSYVVFGKASGFAATLDLSTLNGANGFRLDGAAVDDRSGGSVSAAGDVNGDGFADLIVGAPGADPNGKAGAGASYVVFGGNFTGAVTKLGSASNDSLAGTAATERFVAGQGDDTLTGGGGADVFYGGAGDDTLRVPGLGFQRADGGSGFDTLALTGGGLTLNLADFRNQLDGIERINLTGSGDNTLTLLKRDLLNLSDTGNTLQVDGNAGDHYHLSDSGWVQGVDVTLVGVSYHTFDNGAAHLLLNAALTAV